jgi:hypothetical protein
MSPVVKTGLFRARIERRTRSEGVVLGTLTVRKYSSFSDSCQGQTVRKYGGFSDTFRPAASLFFHSRGFAQYTEYA